MESQDCMVKSISRIGEMLLENGAETQRVEDTMKRIAFHYGADTVDSYATPAMIIISYTLNGTMYHNIKRTKIQKIDLDKVDRLNDLSRRVCNGMSIEEFKRELDSIDQNTTRSLTRMTVLSGLCAFGFGFVFGGDIKDAIICFIIGALLRPIMSYLEKVAFVSLFNYIVLGAFVSLLALFFSHFAGADMDVVIISVDMLLVPGLAITNAIRDIVSDDLISGMTRALEAIVVAVGIALGSAFILKVVGGM